MKVRALAMPDYVANLVRLPLVRMELEPSEATNDAVLCSLLYENGTVLTLVVMCIARSGWFREKPMIVVSIVEMNDNAKIVRVHARENMAIPTDPHDMPFVLRLTAMVRAMAWTLAATSNMGECKSLPGRKRN
jgi:hypothetical protein